MGHGSSTRRPARRASARSVHEVCEQDAGEDAVAGRREPPEHEVAGLLASEESPSRVEGFEDVAVAYRGLAHDDFLSAIARCRPRFDITVTATVFPASDPLGKVGSRTRREARRRCAPFPRGPTATACPRRRRGRDRVGPSSRPSRRASPGASSRSVVDVRAVRIACDHHRPLRRAAREPPVRLHCRAVRAVDDDLETFEGAWSEDVRPDGPRTASTASGSLSSVPTAWPTGARGPPAVAFQDPDELLFDRRLDRVGKLQTRLPRRASRRCRRTGCEKPTPSRRAQSGARESHATPGVGQNAEVDHVGALARHARRRAPPASIGPRPAGVAADRGTTRRAAPVPRRDRAPVTTSGLSSALATPRIPSVPNRAATISISASSTEAPYGPSSGRTSCSPSRGRPG